MEDRHLHLVPGDTLTVMPGIWHRFWTDHGCVFEEISTTAHPNDSVYRDPRINALTTAQRKTVVDHWGRFQLSEQLRRPQTPIQLPVREVGAELSELPVDAPAEPRELGLPVA